MKKRNAFTLIELLIVVAIIAILAAIAVPNFLEAQVRAKVSRAKSDLRSISTAVESYATDWNRYPPNDGKYVVIPVELSTPQAYITSAKLVEPFNEYTQDLISPSEIRSRYYTYNCIVTLQEAAWWSMRGKPCPYEAIDHPIYNKGAFEKYGRWRMVCVGPDGQYIDKGLQMPLRGSDIPYDPTNGTVSFGNILYTPRHRFDMVKQ